MKKALALILLSMLPLQAQRAQADKVLVSAEVVRNQYQVIFRHTIKADPGGQLELKDMFGDVIITGTDSGILEIVEIIRVGRYAPENTEEYASRMSGWLELIPDELPVFTFRVERRRSRYVSTSYNISIPKIFNVFVKSFGGDIDLSHVKGEINIKTGGGDITVANTSGRISIRTSGGDIEVLKAEGQIDIVTSGGDIEGRKIEGKITIKSGGGDIELISGKGTLETETGGGDIDVSDFEGPSIKARTGGGDLDFTRITAVLNLITGGGDIDVSNLIGDLEVATGGGDIDLQQAVGDIILYTNSGDVKAKKINGALRVRSGRGDITIDGWLLDKASKNKSLLETRRGDIHINLSGNVAVSIALKILDTPPRYGMQQIYGNIEFDISREQGNTLGWYDAPNSVHAIEVETRDGTITIYESKD
ncbi:MAG: DUF4097 family beta strand repeat protein [Candidatus Marinimicrobia bacterium]|nr:DUF4097 family beta strand repeat protein [Candidatus Neomarinimicrobiota bacterium]